jgi:hypothetical protein
MVSAAAVRLAHNEFFGEILREVDHSPHFTATRGFHFIVQIMERHLLRLKFVSPSTQSKTWAGNYGAPFGSGEKSIPELCI